MTQLATTVTRGGKDYGLGRQPLPRDDRDWLLADVPLGTYTLASTGADPTRRFYTMVNPSFRMDQGAEGTCVGHGLTNVVMAGPTPHPDFAQFDTVEEAHQFARTLYLEASGDTTYQEGTYTRLGLDTLVRWNLGAAYYRLTSVDLIIDALLHLGPVPFGTYWYDNMFEPTAEYGNSYMRVDTASGIAGGHLYCLTGVHLSPREGPPYVRMENSWGPEWGHNGTARIPLDDLAILFDGDAWVLTETIF